MAEPAQPTGYDDDPLALDQRYVVTVDAEQYGAGLDDRTFATPFVPKLNEFYGRNFYGSYDHARAEPGSFGRGAIGIISTVGKQQLAISVYRLLAEGEPVDRDRLAIRTGLTREHVTELLGALPGVYLDDSDRVIGFWGLTIQPMAHRLLVDDRVLYAWCAWDTLFLPELIGKPGRTTDGAVSLEIGGVHGSGRHESQGSRLSP